MIARLGIAALALCLVAAMVSTDAGAMGRKPAPRRVAGTVRVVGAEPFARTVVTVFRDGVPSDCLVEGPLEPRLRDEYQGREVVVEGAACDAVPPGFADCVVPSKILPKD